MADTLYQYESVIVYEYYAIARGFTVNDDTVTVSESLQLLHTLAETTFDTCSTSEYARYWIDQCVFVEPVSVSDYVAVDLYLGSILRPPTGDIPVYPSQDEAILALTEIPFDVIAIQENQLYAVTYYLFDTASVTDWFPLTEALYISVSDTITIEEWFTTPQQGGSWCWGHDTGVYERNVANLSSGYGSAIVSGSGDSEWLQFEDMNDYMLDPVYTGPAASGYVELNRYSGQAYDVSGLVLLYRTGTTYANCIASEWTSILQGEKFDSYGWMQLYFVAGQLVMDTTDVFDGVLTGVTELYSEPITTVLEGYAVNVGLPCADQYPILDTVTHGLGLPVSDQYKVEEYTVINRGVTLAETQVIEDGGWYSYGGVTFAGQPVTFGGQPVIF